MHESYRGTNVNTTFNQSDAQELHMCIDVCSRRLRIGGCLPDTPRSCSRAFIALHVVQAGVASLASSPAEKSSSAHSRVREHEHLHASKGSASFLLYFFTSLPPSFFFVLISHFHWSIMFCSALYSKPNGLRRPGGPVVRIGAC